MTEQTTQDQHQVIENGVIVTSFERGKCRDIFLNARPENGETAETFFDRVAATVKSFDAQIVTQKVFHCASGIQPCRDAFRRHFGEINWPILWLREEIVRTVPRLAGVYIHAVAGTEVHPIEMGERVVGNWYEDAHARHCFLGDLRPDNVWLSPGDQTQVVVEQMVEALESADMDFSHVVRTWYYNHDILGWYDEFNEVRTKLYTDLGVFERLLPASTGIGSINPFGTALVAGVLAMKPKSDTATAVRVKSPMQNPAEDYGSSFSRAAEIVMPDQRRLYVSGTASIDESGATVHVGDIDAQISLTMDVVHAILKSRNMDWKNVTRSLAYVRNIEDAERYEAYASDHNLESLPTVLTHNVVCRDDLLFEIEVDAVTSDSL
jgi:enamine deaminase RidA (YjgF/YER057c/UK114 family)